MAANKKQSLKYLPKNLNKSLMKFQRKGIRYAIEKNGRCLFGDEMGLGKTLQAIGAAYYYKTKWPLLIICPSSMKFSWVNELEKWIPELQPGDVNIVSSFACLSSVITSKITITSYGLFSLKQHGGRSLTDIIIKTKFGVVILDECHYIKNVKSVRTKEISRAAKSIPHVFMLSGTPSLARPEELYPQLSLLTPGLFGNFQYFADRYCDGRFETEMGRGGKMYQKYNSSGASNLEELHMRLKHNVMIRRLKQQVLTELPPKRRQKIIFQIAENSCYKKEVDKCYDSLKDVVDKLSNDDINADMMTTSFDYKTSFNNLFNATALAKAGAVKQYICDMLQGMDNKFLVFCFHLSMVQAVRQTLMEKHVSHICITGESSSLQRGIDAERFQTDSQCKVAVLSIQAASTGLTLTAADHVVFAELHFTPGVLVQAEDRCHRIGQLNAVQIHYLIAMGTIDEVLWSKLQKKVMVTSTTLNGEVVNDLEADDCTDQHDVLSNVAAWIPFQVDQQNISMTALFEKESDPKQRKITDILNNKQTKKRKLKKKKTSNGLVVISSDEEDFKMKKKRKIKKENQKIDEEGNIVATKKFDILANANTTTLKNSIELTEDNYNDSINLTSLDEIKTKLSLETLNEEITVQVNLPHQDSSVSIEEESPSSEIDNSPQAKLKQPAGENDNSPHEKFKQPASVQCSTKLRFSKKKSKSPVSNTQSINRTSLGINKLTAVPSNIICADKKSHIQYSTSNIMAVVNQYKTSSESDELQTESTEPVIEALSSSDILNDDSVKESDIFENVNPVNELGESPTPIGISKETFNLDDSVELIESKSKTDQDSTGLNVDTLVNSTELGTHTLDNDTYIIKETQERCDESTLSKQFVRTDSNLAETNLFKIEHTCPLNDEFENGDIQNGALQPDHWQCEQCTFLNHALLSMCEMCDFKRIVAKYKLRNSAEKKSQSSNTKVQSNKVTQCLIVTNSNENTSNLKLNSNQENNTNRVHTPKNTDKTVNKVQTRSTEDKSYTVESELDNSLVTKVAEETLIQSTDRDTQLPESSNSEYVITSAVKSSVQEERLLTEADSHLTSSSSLQTINGNNGSDIDLFSSDEECETSHHIENTCGEESMDLFGDNDDIDELLLSNHDLINAIESTQSSMTTLNTSMNSGASSLNTSLCSPSLCSHLFQSPNMSINHSSVETADVSLFDDTDIDSLMMELDENKMTSQNEVSDQSSSEDESEASNEIEVKKLSYRASYYTDRIFVYSQEDSSYLRLHFKIQNIVISYFDELAPYLQHPQHLKQIKYFTHLWQQLGSRKQSLLKKCKEPFVNPSEKYREMYEETYGQKKKTKNRYVTKSAEQEGIRNLAENIGGNVVEIKKRKQQNHKKVSAKSDPTETTAPIKNTPKPASSETTNTNALQALDKDGNPLCLCCSARVFGVKAGTLESRFCSDQCMKDYKVRRNYTHNGARSLIFDLEQGVCQICGFNAHALYERMCNVPAKNRKDMLQGTPFLKLSIKVLNTIVKTPKEGQKFRRTNDSERRSERS